jgi:hypothetical protein
MKGKNDNKKVYIKRKLFLYIDINIDTIKNINCQIYVLTCMTQLIDSVIVIED